MFDDPYWVEDRSEEQQERFEVWLAKVRLQNLVVIEIGAGNALPTVRRLSDSLTDAKLIRINPNDTDVPPHGLALKSGALEALIKINEIIE